MIFFRDPQILFLIPFIILIFLLNRKKSQGVGLKFSEGELLDNLKPSLKIRLGTKLVYLKLVAFILIIFALARPQFPIAESKIEREGVDIALLLDSSTSMLAEDFTIKGQRLARIEVIKDVVKKFIEGRHDDRIGVVTFAARAYTVSPLTLDYGWVSQNLERIHAGMIEDGTAIGTGLATALKRLKDTKAKSKIVILLTDGRNNTGNISPLTAAEAAKALNIKVYTIGAGSKGLVPYPVQDIFGSKSYQMLKVDLDEESLQKIADITGGKYYRATDTESLKKIYQDIDRLERTPIEEKGYMEYRELFILFLLPGVILLFIEILLSNTVFRKIP